ncbi:uncharacterized protein (DUF58 family) [Mycobacterium frederiksbergense]|uniref:Uncharacterized protein (DUF58 family) n=1 Tax=Mycolicibacterium frederiksbergense TaxID=117567 RepID=A0ABT6L4U7_9MYCO|nr:DUF58 domain-containing protein [Mycolicibacterium frederiksbergense]MDH6197981.1 uncharacterized protein (DUF58 family) [Mycolicibacterium frederiksbergense]
MGRHLNRSRQFFGNVSRSMLQGGKHALLHTRTLEFDDLRPYVPGDDIRDINWKASARSSDTLVTKFVTEKHHKILLVCDTGRNMTALAPSGEFKRDIAVVVAGVIGMISMSRSDELGMVYGDARGSAAVRSRKGENHIEGMLDQLAAHGVGDVGESRILTQLNYVAHSHRARLLMVVIADEPEVTQELEEAVKRLAGRHELLWVAISDMAAVGADQGEMDGYDVGTGRFVPDGTTLGQAVVDAYRRAEQQRMAELDRFFERMAVPFVRIGGSAEVRNRITHLTEVYSHAR